MANIKISELNEQENRNDEDLLAIVDVNNNETKKVKVKTLAPQNVEIALISDTEPTSGIHQGEMYYNTTTNKLYTYVGGGVYIDNGEPKFGILYIIYSSQTIYTYNGTTLINIGGSGNYSELDGKPSINGNTLNGNKTNTDLGIPNALNEHSDSTEDTYSCDYANNHQLNAKILWTNPNPTSAILNETTITLSSNDYDTLKIFYQQSTSDSRTFSIETLKGVNGRIWATLLNNNNVNMIYRNFNRNSDISYTIGTIVGTNDANFIIPTYVVGYKTGLFN